MKSIKFSKKEINSSKPALIVMSKWPAAGRCKQRLAKDIGPYNASSIQNKLTNHVLSVAKILEDKNLIEIYFAIAGLAPKAAKRWGMIRGIKNTNCQGKGSLGLRMRKQILIVQRSKLNQISYSRPTIILGSDLPYITHEDLIEAIGALQDNDLVIGPSKDGGYWLLGLTRKLLDPIASWPFCDIPWGTNTVLSSTIENAKLKSIKYKLIKEHTDLDYISDIK